MTGKTFSERLVALRTERGMSRYAVCKAGRLNQAHMIRLERGLAEPSLDTAVRIARALGVSVAVFEDVARPRTDIREKFAQQQKEEER